MEIAHDHLHEGTESSEGKMHIILYCMVKVCNTMYL